MLSPGRYFTVLIGLNFINIMMNRNNNIDNMPDVNPADQEHAALPRYVYFYMVF
jgi:hypothetical protein